MNIPNSQRALPVLVPGTPVLVREDGSLHIGYDPATALIVRLDPPAIPAVVADVLGALRRPLYRDQLRAKVRAAGLTAASFSVLLDRLVTAGKARLPAASYDAGLRVRILGDDALARRLADELTDAGLVVVGDPLGPSSVSRFEHLDCRLVVLADRLGVDPAVAAGLMTARLPHLPVVVQDGAGMIGPLVLPGHSSCLRCADLHRCDLDPEWPLLTTRLATVPGGDDPVTVALTALMARQEIAGLAARLADPAGAAPQTLGHRLRVRVQPAGTDLLAAPVHPACDCCYPPPGPAVHYPRSRRKDCVERRDHTGAGPSKCEAGGAAARHGRPGRGRIRQAAGRQEQG